MTEREVFFDRDYDHDVFVSYARADDDGWVQGLVSDLRVFLRRQLRGREPRIFFDTRSVRPGDKVPKELIDGIRSSRTFVVVLSPQYIGSAWCLTELDTFQELYEREPGRRVIVAQAEWVDRCDCPPALLDADTHPLTQVDEVNGLTVRLDPSFGEEYKARFKRRVNELALFIGKILNTPREEALSYKGDVWIAQPTDDMDDEWQNLAAVVTQQGWRVVPKSPYPTHDLGVYGERVHQHLRNAHLFVQLFGPSAGRRPVWNSPSCPVIQANAAREVSARRNVRWLRWRSKSPVSQSDPEYAALWNEGEVRVNTPAEFQAEVIAALTAPPPPPPQPLRPPRRGDDPLIVYIHNGQEDEKLATELQDLLEKLRAESIPTLTIAAGQSPDEIRARQRQVLQDCDGVILVYGNASPDWVSQNFSLLRKAFAPVRPAGKIGVLDGPPPTKGQMPRIVSPAIWPLPCRNGVDMALLEQFLSRVRESQQDGASV